MSSPKLRIARPSDNLEALIKFYGNGLGLDILSRFENHDGFDGVMLGNENAAYHFEFTHSHFHVAGRAPTQDNLLVFYIPNRHDWRAAIARMEKSGFSPVAAFNPYWEQNGCTFEDPDGYRVVFQNAEWDT